MHSSEQGKLDEARENYLMALKLNPDNPEADYNLGVLLLRQGKAGEASKRICRGACDSGRIMAMQKSNWTR